MVATHAVRQVERRQVAIDELLRRQVGLHLRVGDDEGVHAHHHGQQDALVLGQAEGQERRVEHLLVVLAVELDPREVAQHERVAVVDPDVPGRAQRAVDRHHDDRQAVEARHHDVLGHVGQPVRRAGGERARAGERGADADAHGAVLALDRDHVPLAERELRHILDDLGLRRDRIDAARRAAGETIGFAGRAQRVARGMVPGDQLCAHDRPLTCGS